MNQRSDTSKPPRAPLIGAVIAGGLASACCLGPLIVVLLGLGSASAFVALEPYRPVFATVTLGLLAWAGWRHWRGRWQCTAAGCPPQKPVMLWLLGGLALLLLITPEILNWLTAARMN